jgi:uncharacterized phage protein (TIGR02218 family)
MKTVSGALQAILASGQFYLADMYTFVLVDGTVLRYASGDADVTDESAHVYSSSGPLIERTSVTWKVGLEVDSLEVDIYPRDTDMVGSLTFMAAMRAGKFDGCEVEVRRAFMSSYGDGSNGTVVVFAGRISSVELGRTRIAATINHFTELLNVKMPRNLYMPSCQYTLFDAGCLVNRASYTWTYSVGSGATTFQIPVPSTGKADHYFDQGVLVIGSERRRIKVWDLDTAVVVPPLPSAPALGTSVTMTAGCSRTRDDCEDKFSNLARFRGFPFVPQPEAGV